MNKLKLITIRHNGNDDDEWKRPLEDDAECYYGNCDVGNYGGGKKIWL